MGQNIQKKNQKKHERVCEKIHRAISVTNPAKIIHRISNRSQSPSPSNPEETVRNINIKTKHNPSDEHVRVKFAETTDQIEKPMFKTKPFGKLESKDERFTDFIKRAKLKIRAMTSAGDFVNSDASETENKTAAAYTSKQSGKDHFSEFIKRAKMKIRATSSMGGGGNRTYDSFKFSKD